MTDSKQVTDLAKMMLTLEESQRCHTARIEKLEAFKLVVQPDSELDRIWRTLDALRVDLDEYVKRGRQSYPEPTPAWRKHCLCGGKGICSWCINGEVEPMLRTCPVPCKHDCKDQGTHKDCPVHMGADAPADAPCGCEESVALKAELAELRGFYASVVDLIERKGK